MSELSSSQSDTGGPLSGHQCVTLVKDEQRWRFHLELGREHEMIDAVADMASDLTHPLDWFDAAIISHQITKQLETPDSMSSGASTDIA